MSTQKKKLPFSMDKHPSNPHELTSVGIVHVPDLRIRGERPEDVTVRECCETVNRLSGCP